MKCIHLEPLKACYTCYERTSSTLHTPTQLIRTQRLTLEPKGFEWNTCGVCAIAVKDKLGTNTVLWCDIF